MGWGAAVRWRRLACALATFAVPSLTDCRKSSPDGELVVAFATDISTPKEFDSFRVEIRTPLGVVHAEDYAIEAGGRPLPATLGIVPADDARRAVSIRVIARQGGISGRVRLLRDARTQVPKGRIAVLPMTLNAACLETVKEVAPGTLESTCGPDRTCAAGACVAVDIPETELPNYDPSAPITVPEAPPPPPPDAGVADADAPEAGIADVGLDARDPDAPPPPITWVEQAPATRPPPRHGHVMVYDPARQRTLLFGGVNPGGGMYNDTWEWDGATWTLRTPAASPPGRAIGGMVYDSARRRVLLYGGLDGSAARFVGDTWEWDGTNWAQRSPPTSVPARAHFGMTFDAARGRAVIFGGYSVDDAHLFDTWEWDGQAWARALPPLSPPGRNYHTTVYDGTRRRTLLFGGYQAAIGLLNDTWDWDGITWTEKTFDASPAPSPRIYHAMADDPERHVVLLFGGTNSILSTSVPLNDLWQWDGVAWTQRETTPAPSPRANSVLVFDAARHVFVMFGGLTKAGAADDTWTFAN